MAAFLTWGYMQEKITTSAYVNAATGETGRWQFSYVLNALMALSGLGLGAVALAVEGSLAAPRAGVVVTKERALPSPWAYMKPALSNTLASPLGYYALRYINFPM
jgi:hypothetical protein